jgi:hypothetical protein
VTTVTTLRRILMSSGGNECSKARVAHPRAGLSNPCEAVDQQKREASLKVIALMLPLDVGKFPHPQARSRELADAGKWLLIKGILVDLIGIEPMTSSMPFGITPVESMAYWGI